MNNPITDINVYNNRMAKSAIDKIFFFDKVDANVFIDIGCANGYLLKLCARLFPEHKYIGFDIDEKMIEEAKKDNPNNIIFTSDWEEVVKPYHLYDGYVCVILSSIIHEVYSYNRQGVDDFWKRIWDLKAKFVAIRDMSYSESCCRPSDPITVARIHQIAEKNIIKEWEARWGSLSENWSLTHFLLKYHYLDNWVRELNENYLPLSKESLLQLIPREYSPILIEHYTLPFIRRKVKKDFGIELQERTHLKLILGRETT